LVPEIRILPMGYGLCDIQVLDENWNVVETITNEDLKPLV